jgi:hypothetical protein
MIKKLLVKWLFFLYRKDYYKPLNKVEVDSLIIKLARTEGFRELPAYLNQCAENAKRQYLYSNDPIFKGTVLAFITLREQIEKAAMSKKNKETLTPDENNAIMKKRGY